MLWSWAPQRGVNFAQLLVYLNQQMDRLQRALVATRFPVIDARDFGIVGNGTSDNAAPFAKLSAAVNASPNRPTVHFPEGVYRYTDGLVFTREVHLLGVLGATLDYAGTGKAMKLGPDGLTDLNYQSHQRYAVEGLTFTGGASMTHGIYFNDHVTQPRVLRCGFTDFGNATAWAVFGQADNWDTFISACDWYTTPSNGPARNWICMNGVSAGGTWDNGNSRLRMKDCLGSDQNQTHGIGVYVNGSYNDIAHNKIEGFLPNYRVAGTGTGTRFSDVYFEVTDDGYCIEYGDPAGSPRVGNFLSDLRIEGCYVNLHNDDAINVAASFLGPTTSSTGLQNLLLDDIQVASLNVARPLVVLLNKLSQINNRAYRLRGVTVLHTTGANIAEWGGEQGDSFATTGAIASGGDVSAAGDVAATGDVRADGDVVAAGRVLTGKSGSATGGAIRFVDDGGTSRWYVGLAGTAGARALSIYDLVNAAIIAEIDPTTGRLHYWKALEPHGEFRHRGTTLGFYGAAATTQPTVTGSHGGNAASASLAAAGALLGLWIDSTTP